MCARGPAWTHRGRAVIPQQHDPNPIAIFQRHPSVSEFITAERLRPILSMSVLLSLAAGLQYQQRKIVYFEMPILLSRLLGWVSFSKMFSMFFQTWPGSCEASIFFQIPVLR